MPFIQKHQQQQKSTASTRTNYHTFKIKHSHHKCICIETFVIVGEGGRREEWRGEEEEGQHR